MIEDARPGEEPDDGHLSVNLQRVGVEEDPQQELGNPLLRKLSGKRRIRRGDGSKKRSNAQDILPELGIGVPSVAS